MWVWVAAAFAVFLFLFDFQNVLAWNRRRVLEPCIGGEWDFTVVVPVYGNRRYFEDRAHFAWLKPLVLVAMDIACEEMRAFADELEAEGWRVFRCAVHQPAPPKLLLAALDAGVVTTRYVVRMDADTSVGEDLPRIIKAVRVYRVDLCSVKVHVRNRQGLIGRLQALEYEMAMLSRHFRPWMTSGACFIARADAARRIFRNHSMWFPGEDMETGRTANALRLKIMHANLHVETDAPASWRALFRQRRMWWAGNFRHVVMNFDRNAPHMPMWTFYYVALVWCGVYFKGWHVFTLDLRTLAEYVVLVLGLYVVVTFVANWQVRSPWMILFPAYALFHCLVVPIFGAPYYALLVKRQGGLGRYRFGFWRSARRPQLVGSA